MRRLAAVLLVVLAACAGAAPEGPDITAAANGSDGGGRAPVAAAPQQGRDRPDTGLPRLTTSGPRTDEDRSEGPRSGPGERNTMPLTVTLARDCVPPGGEMRAHVQTLPRAKLAFGVVYDDGGPPDYVPSLVKADDEGRYTWTWVVRPTAPEGDALLSVVATKGDKGGSYDQWFRVSPSC